MNIGVWKAVKRNIGVLHTTVSTHNASISPDVVGTRSMEFSLEKQRIFVIFRNVRANVYRLWLCFSLYL